MKNVNAILCIASLLVKCGCAFGDELYDEPRMQARDEARSIFDYSDQYPPGLNVWLPERALNPDDLERWCRILQCSDEQRHFMDLMYGEFVERHNAFLDRETPRYFTESAELWDLYRAEGANSPKVAQLSIRNDRNTRLLREAFIQMEYSLIELLEPILTDEQRDRLPTIYYDARRRNCRTVSRTVRWLNIELREIAEQTFWKSTLADVLQEVEVLLNAHEALLTPLVCKCADLQFDTRRKLAANRIATFEGSMTPEELHAKYVALFHAWHDVTVQIASLNQRTTDGIASLLPDVERTAFTMAVKVSVFPELYPDSTTLHALFAKLKNDTLLGAELRTAADALLQDYETGYARICDSLEKLCIDYDDRRNQGVYEKTPLAKTLDPLILERRQLSVDFLLQLTAIAGPEAIERHSHVIPELIRQSAFDPED